MFVHHDVAGEPQYLETVQAELSSEAESKGVHLVGSCGFDSVPADMGSLFLQDNFPGGYFVHQLLAVQCVCAGCFSFMILIVYFF